MESNLYNSGPLGDIVSTDEAQQSLHSLQWEEARLYCSRDEFVGRLHAAEKGLPNLNEQLEIYSRGHEGERDFTGLIRFNDWLLQQRITGPYIRIPLLQLLYKEMSALNNMSVDETSRRISALVEHVSRITVANHNDRSITILGDLLPQEYILRTGGSGQALRLRHTPRWSLDRTPLSQMIDWDGEGIGEDIEQLCTPCRRDPESALGGSQFCGLRGGILEYRECTWPPVEPPPRQYEYTVHVGNRWWTTFVGVWHGSAYTRTTRRWANTTLPWIVPEIDVWVGSNFGNITHEDSTCIFWGLDGNSATSYNDDEVSVGRTQFAFVKPWGITSYHNGGGRAASYYCGYWH